MRQIHVSVDVFAAIWAARLPHEGGEDEVLARLLKIRRRDHSQALAPVANVPSDDHSRSKHELPRSARWTDVLIWTFEQLGGQAKLADIYRVSRLGRSRLGRGITPEHDASARECLESHCLSSKKFRGKADLFYMPDGKGAGVWALRRP